MAAIQLPPAEYLRQCFDYDPDTGILTWRHRPIEHFADERAYRIFDTRYTGTRAGDLLKRPRRLGFYIRVSVDRRRYLAHRIIWKLVYGVDPSALIDHRDVDGTNNRISNLRDATYSQNSANMKARAAFKGAKWDPRRQKWDAKICHNGMHFYLGSFSTGQEAHDAYCAKAAELHGEFARFK